MSKSHKKDWRHCCCLSEFLVNQNLLQFTFFFFNIRKFIFTTLYCLHSVIHNTHRTGLELVIPTGGQLQLQRSRVFMFYRRRDAFADLSWLWKGIAYWSTHLKSAAQFEKTYRIFWVYLIGDCFSQLLLISPEKMC